MNTEPRRGKSTGRAAEPTAARNAPRPLRAQQLFDAMFELCQKRIEPSLLATLAELEQRLFKLAERSHSDAEQQQYLDSSRQVKEDRADLARRFMRALNEHMASFDTDLPEDSTRQRSNHAKLELLATQTLEENIAAEDMAARGESRASMVLFELGHRFAVLGGSPLIRTEALPLGPYSVSRALQHAAAGLDIPIAHRLELYRLFDTGVMAHLTSFYDALNELLVARGILPNLRAFMPRRRSSGDASDDSNNNATAEAVTRNDDVDRDSSTDTGADNAAEGVADVAQTDNDQETFAALSELLAQRRRVMGTERAARGGHLASTDDLGQVLANLQTRAPDVRRAGGKLQPRSMQHLRQDMLAQLRQLHPDAAAPRLAAEHVDVIELTTMLFDRLVEDLHSENGNNVLSRLQVPMLRVALSDHDFFTERKHPARLWLNTVAEASNRWGGDGEEGDPSLIEKMGALVARANAEFTGDPSMFVGMTDELQQHVDTLAHKAEVTERRYVEASKGRERLELARQRAHELINERLAGSTVSSLTRAMLQHAWADLLALILLREGEDSEAFRRKLEVADTLTRGTENVDREQLCVDIEHGLAQVGVQARDAQLLARHAVDAPTLEDAEEPVTRTELAVKLKQRKSLGDADDSEVAAIAKPEPSLSTDEQRMLDRIKSLAFGTWFEVDDEDTGAVVKRKMAWYSTRTGRCLFVNQRGAHAKDINLEQLARAMVAGTIRLPPAPKGSLLDRAWDSIVNKLKNLAPASTPAAEGTSK